MQVFLPTPRGCSQQARSTLTAFATHLPLCLATSLEAQPDLLRQLKTKCTHPFILNPVSVRPYIDSGGQILDTDNRHCHQTSTLTVDRHFFNTFLTLWVGRSTIFVHKTRGLLIDTCTSLSSVYGHLHTEMKEFYIDAHAKWKTRKWRQIHTADQVAMDRKSCLYQYYYCTGMYSVLARLSVLTNWINCMYLAQFPRLPFCGLLYIKLLNLCVLPCLFLLSLKMLIMTFFTPKQGF